MYVCKHKVSRITVSYTQTNGRVKPECRIERNNIEFTEQVNR